MRPMNRLTPKLSVVNYKTYSIAAPRATHQRKASCDEVDCLAQQYGWRMKIDEGAELGQRQAFYIRKESGRAFTEYKEAGLTVFEFQPGQRCFKEHFVSLDRPEFYAVRGGDWRGNPTGWVRNHTKPELWVEDFAEHQEKIAKERE